MPSLSRRIIEKAVNTLSVCLFYTYSSFQCEETSLTTSILKAEDTDMCTIL